MKCGRGVLAPREGITHAPNRIYCRAGSPYPAANDERLGCRGLALNQRREAWGFYFQSLSETSAGAGFAAGQCSPTGVRSTAIRTSLATPAGTVAVSIVTPAF